MDENNNNALAVLNNSVENGVIAVFEKNERTGGMSCIFKKGNEYFYADKSFIPYTWYGWETMIFRYDFQNMEVPSWNELYSDRTNKSLEDCIEEFAGCKIIQKEYISHDTNKLPA